MQSESLLRQAAVLLLESAIRIAPRDVREWGQAMLAELDYVGSPFAMLAWSLGGAGVLLRHAIAALFMPGRHDVPLGEGIFARNVSLRKVALFCGAVLVLGTLIFFAAPPFRQGLQVSLTAWSALFQAGSPESNAQPALRDLARRAEARRDPQGLAFVAVRMLDPQESARLSDEAVRLEPGFRWVYAVVAVRHPDLGAARGWIPQLERWDPQNALFYLAAAERIDVDRINKTAGPEARPAAEDDPAWQSAMASAFAAPKFDDYLDRLAQLDREVVPRYGFYNLYAVVSEEATGLPTYAYSDSRQFANSLLESGTKLEAAGDLRDALQKYWAVARFGQVIDSHASTDYERWAGTAIQFMAYRRLRLIYAARGNAGEAALFGYLADKFETTSSERDRALSQWVFGRETLLRNAVVLQVSSLAAAGFAVLILTAAIVLIAIRRRNSERPAVVRLKSKATLLAVLSAFGLFLSSASIYLTYRPYWYIFQRAILNGDQSRIRDLRLFLQTAASIPAQIRVQFWTAVILLGIFGIVFLLLRQLRSHTRIDAPQHSGRVP